MYKMLLNMFVKLAEEQILHLHQVRRDAMSLRVEGRVQVLQDSRLHPGVSPRKVQVTLHLRVRNRLVRQGLQRVRLSAQLPVRIVQLSLPVQLLPGMVGDVLSQA